MFKPGALRSITAQLIVLTTIFLYGCGIKGTSANCSATAPSISVLDSGFRRDCGCSEGASGIMTSGFTCTVPVGATMTVQYPNIQNAHNLVVYFSGNTFRAFNHDPTTDGDNNPTDAFLLNSSGTFNINDTLTGFSGTLTVTP